MTINIEKYLSKCGLSTPSLTETSLYDIQTKQLKRFPFENIDCFHHQEIRLSPQDLQLKLIDSERGGYCFELNQLLLESLKILGFKVRPLLSRVMYRGVGINPKTHILLLAELNSKKYLVDAGFGGPGLYSPMPFELNRIDKQLNGNFKLEADDEFGTILKKESEPGVWSNVYAFTEDLVYPADLEMSNFYTSQLPTSHFRSNLIAALFTDEGRFTLLNRKFTTTKNDGAIKSKDIESEAELKNILQEKFKIGLPTTSNFARLF